MQSTEPKEKKGGKNKIYRISVLNDETHEKLFVFRCKKNNVIIGAAAIFLLYTFTLISIIFYTPVRKLIPGYPDANLKAEIYKAKNMEDSIIREMAIWELYISNIEKIMSGEPPVSKQEMMSMRDSIARIPREYLHSRADSTLRRIVRNNINSGEDVGDRYLEGLHFFKPVEGITSSGYNIAENHPYIDIAASENSVVSSVLPGTVISDEYTDEYGYSIKIQHSHNLISIYRHNKKALKHRGDKVEAGTAIGLIGKDGGTVSTGPHLHFELWHNGEAINPENYINF